MPVKLEPSSNLTLAYMLSHYKIVAMIRIVTQHILSNLTSIGEKVHWAKLQVLRIIVTINLAN